VPHVVWADLAQPQQGLRTRKASCSSTRSWVVAFLSSAAAQKGALSSATCMPQMVRGRKHLLNATPVH
jgi:hypothetical protein